MQGMYNNLGEYNCAIYPTGLFCDFTIERPVKNNYSLFNNDSKNTIIRIMTKKGK